MIFTDTEAIAKVKSLSEQSIKWVTTAAENSKIYKALVLGKDFSDVLIERIEFIESKKKAEARKKYSKDIRDVFERVMKPRENVFQSNGGSEKILIKNEELKKRFIKAQSNFKSNKSVFKYLSETYFQLCDVDPNGVLFLEYESNSTPYPTYKCIDEIADYKANGQKLEYIVFKPEDTEGSEYGMRTWRIVDDVNDRIIVEIRGLFILSKSKTFTHPFGETPGLVLSSRETMGSDIRTNAIDKILELSKDYARDKSVLNIYKFQKGYPIHWRFITQCKTCTGTGKADNATCDSCDGHGYVRNTDVTDIVTLPIPDIDQPNIAPNIAGYVSPDLDTWKQYKEDIKDLEKVMKDTIWGTNLYSNSNKNMIETETATGRHIDVQPIINVLNTYADEAEYVDNTICNWIARFVDPIESQELVYNKTYGRRFIIENPDVILLKYQEAKKTSDSSAILDKLLEEFILSKYKNEGSMQDIMLKKKNIEPYVHMTLEQVFNSFGAEEAYKKELFNNFWVTCDVNATQDELQKAFDAYAIKNKKDFTPKVEPQKVNQPKK